MLVQSVLKTAVKAAIKQAETAASGAKDIPTAQELYAETLATALSIAIDVYIRSGTVVTFGSATTQTGVMT